MDLLIVLSGWKKLTKNKVITVVFFFMAISLVVGLLNYNELSRRFITDFTNPFFFFAKIYIFKAYWRGADFSKYITKYYIRVSFWGSLLLLPLVYSIFSGAGATRLAIFPPMEIPFSYYMQSGGIYFFLSLIIIILYGKRAQLVSAILVFFTFILRYKFSHFPRYIVLASVAIGLSVVIFNQYAENLAIRRITNSIELILEGREDSEILNAVSAGRGDEIEAIIKDMELLDFIVGYGLGTTIDLETNESKKTVGNIHFSPLSFMAKYGIFFTVFLYCYILYHLLSLTNTLSENKTIAIVAWGTCSFVFIESFFAYALFVTPIFPVSFGYLIYFNSRTI